MNRRNFIGKLTKLTAVAVVAPVAIAKALEKPEELYVSNIISLGTFKENETYIVQEGNPDFEFCGPVKQEILVFGDLKKLDKCQPSNKWGILRPDGTIVTREYGDNYE